MSVGVKTEGDMYTPTALAYLGDAVFELLAREKYIRESNIKPGKLHKKTIRIVNATAQAKMADSLLDILSEEEADVYRRGRNAAAHAAPKTASPADYCKATGLEAVFGKLCIDGSSERIKELFEYCIEKTAQGSDVHG